MHYALSFDRMMGFPEREEQLWHLCSVGIGLRKKALEKLGVLTSLSLAGIGQRE